jgi:transposase
MLATLDPLGMPVAVDVAPGQCSDGTRCTRP